MELIKKPVPDVRDMFVVHTVFRREFGLMARLVGNVEVNDVLRAAIVAEHIGLMTLFLQMHHLGEDRLIWPLLRQRGGSEIAPVITTMQAQHEAIHRNLLQISDAVESWRDNASWETRESLADIIAGLLRVVDEHLADEEKRVLPLIERYVTAPEYERVAKEGGAQASPDKVVVFFGMAMYEAPPEVIETMLQQMPAHVQTLIASLAKKTYAGYANELYGTTAPARSTALSRDGRSDRTRS